MNWEINTGLTIWYDLFRLTLRNNRLHATSKILCSFPSKAKLVLSASIKNYLPPANCQWGQYRNKPFLHVNDFHYILSRIKILILEKILCSIKKIAIAISKCYSINWKAQRHVCLTYKILWSGPKAMLHEHAQAISNKISYQNNITSLI